MKLINYDEYNSLRVELNEFVVLCKKYNYTPSKNEFDDAIRFILLQSSTGTALCESYEINPFKILNHLYESFEFDKSLVIDESGQDPYTGEKDFDSAVGTVTTGAKMAGAAALGGAVAVGVFISYLFKKGKVKKMVKAELDAELNKLQGWQKLAEERNKLAKLKGESVKIDWPGMAQGGGGDKEK